MMGKGLRAYVIIVSALGLGAGVIALLVGDLSGLARQSASPLADVAFFVLLGCLLDMMIVPMARGGAVSAGFSVFYAAVLILGPYVAAFVALVATCCTDLLTRRQVPLYKTCFNVGHSMISLLVAGGLYYQVLGGEIGRLELTTPAGFARCLLLALVIFCMEITAVNLAVALERRISLRSVWLVNASMVLPLDSALAGVGLLMALIFEHRESLFEGYGLVFVAIVLLVPSLLLFYASKLYADIHRVYDKTLHTLSSLMESKMGPEGAALRHYEQEGHGQRVASLAVALGEELGLAGEEVLALRYAGYLHDIGKVGLPIDQQTAEAEYWQPVDNHAGIGYEVLKPINFLAKVAVLVRDHHQRYDAPAPPAGMGEGAALLCSYILQVAEAYESLVAPPPQHAAVDPGYAVERIVREAGARFHPRVVEALVRQLLRGKAITILQAEKALHAI